MEYLSFSWLLPGTLAGAQGPTRRRDLVFLKLRDVRALIRMEEQTISGEGAELTDLYEPVPDYTAPQPDQLDRMVGFIEEQIETWQHPVVVTCQAGMGRTGTVLACYLVYTGYSPQNAIDFVREKRDGSIQSPEQVQAIHQYSELLKSRKRDRRRKALEALHDLD